jgi:hypothetical protein
MAIWAILAKAAAAAAKAAVKVATKAATAIGHGAQAAAKPIAKAATSVAKPIAHGVEKVWHSDLAQGALGNKATATVNSGATEALVKPTMSRSIGLQMNQVGRNFAKQIIAGGGESGQSNPIASMFESVEQPDQASNPSLGQMAMKKMGAMMENPLESQRPAQEETQFAPIAPTQMDTSLLTPAPTTGGSAPIAGLSQQDIEYLMLMRQRGNMRGGI